MSMIPMGGHIIRPNPYLVDHYPDFYLSMGLATENVARKYEVTREQQDEFALRSHTRAAAALDADKFADEIVPLHVALEELDDKGKKQRREVVFNKDEGVRRDSSAEGLAKLKPAFHVKGTITAGNASQMSDGAAAAIVMSDSRARELGAKPMARFIAYATAGCPPEEMGIGPVFAIPKALKLAGLTLNDIDVIELNEAFAAQSIAVIKTLGLDPDKVNVNGGMVTMCVGGGMGAAGILERI
jgi:acetyl-CoA acyltransferase